MGDVEPQGNTAEALSHLEPGEETRQERREKRRRREKEKMPQHGASLKRVYSDAISKRSEEEKPAK